MSPKRRWYRLTPDRLLVVLLAAVLLLLLVDRFELFGLQRGSGWSVLLAMGLVIAAVPVGLLWLGVSRLLRRPFQFSVRSLLLFVLVCAIPCSWFAVKMEAAARQKEAREVLWGFPGIKRWDYEYPPPAQQPPGPTWLNKLLGEDFLCDVEFLCLGGGDEFTDAELAHVAHLPRLRFLRIAGAGITDRGMEHLRGLRELEDLNLCATQITDAGLAHLKHSTKLQRLWLHGTQVTDAGLVQLAGLTKLRSLGLRETQVTPQGVDELQKVLPDCKIDY